MELVELKHKLERVPQSSTMQRGWPDAGKVETTDEHGHEKERRCFLRGMWGSYGHYSLWGGGRCAACPTLATSRRRLAMPHDRWTSSR